MSQELYYTAPLDSSFNEMKEACKEIWSQYDDTYGYATEKINRIKDLQNVKDNFMYMAAMFDWENLKILLSTLSADTRKEFTDRMDQNELDSILSSL